jgi:hypothetical protein
MRKHLLSGVVIASLIGLGGFTHRSVSPHRTTGTSRAGIQLASADLPVDPTGAVRSMVPADTTNPTDTIKKAPGNGAPGNGAPGNTAPGNTAPGNTAPGTLFGLLADDPVEGLGQPAATPAPVPDPRVAQLTGRADVTAFRAAEALKQVQEKAYLVAEAIAKRPRPAPVVTAPRPVVAAARSVVAGPDPFVALRDCESGGNYGDDTGNGYYGAYQFTLSSWRDLGLGGLPSQAPPAVQDRAAQELQARRGWGQWPACSRRLGL